MSIRSFLQKILHVPESSNALEMVLFNTRSKQKELFKPLSPKKVKVYSCGPTVYSRSQIGNLRAFVIDDILHRTLRFGGYTVDHVINITDVGHLTGDADEGEDKLETAAKKEARTAVEIARHYTDLFFEDLMQLHIPLANYSFPRATDYIDAQINFIKELEAKGHIYKIDDGIYFDTSTFPNYGILGKAHTVDTQDIARIEKNEQKKNASDFALWKFSGNSNRQQEWESPWGVGFPGWHLECSVMSRSLLGDQLDIHTGGEDHIPIHHNNEIAQSESVTQKPYVRYWLHNAFLTIDGKRIGKSVGNAITLLDLTNKGFDPLSLRYFFLEAHYRTPQSFTFDALTAAQNAYEKLMRFYKNNLIEVNSTTSDPKSIQDFTLALYDDLNTPQALAVLWEVVKNPDLEDGVKKATLLSMDEVFGLGLANLSQATIPEKVTNLLKKREALRRTEEFEKADLVRDDIESLGFVVHDTPEGVKVEKK